MADFALFESRVPLQRKPEQDVGVEKQHERGSRRLPHSSKSSAGERTSPLMRPLALEEPKDPVGLNFDGHEFGDRFSVPGYINFLVPIFDVVHDREALGFEGSGRDCFQSNLLKYGPHTMVIIESVG